MLMQPGHALGVIEQFLFFLFVQSVWPLFKNLGQERVAARGNGGVDRARAAQQVAVIDWRAADAPARFVHSLLHTGFAVLTHHPIDTALLHRIEAEWDHWLASPAVDNCRFDPLTQDGYVGPERSETAKGQTEKDLKAFFHHYPGGRYPQELSDAALRYRAQAEALAAQLLDWVQTHAPEAARRSFPQPLPEMIAGSRQTLLRILPGKRVVGGGVWRGRRVLAKLFVAEGSARHWQRECDGLAALAAACERKSDGYDSFKYPANVVALSDILSSRSQLASSGGLVVMTTVRRPGRPRYRRMPSAMRASVTASTAVVGSRSTRMGASATSARACATASKGDAEREAPRPGIVAPRHHGQRAAARDRRGS